MRLLLAFGLNFALVLGVLVSGCTGAGERAEHGPRLPPDLAGAVPLSPSLTQTSGAMTDESPGAARPELERTRMSDAGAARWPVEAGQGAELLGGRLGNLDPERILLSTVKMTLVYSTPSKSAAKLGYLRSGAVVARSPEPATTQGCPEGFYEIEPEGYVCMGRQASAQPDHILAKAHATRPDRAADLPYTYGRSKYPTPPFYSRIPSHKEQQVVEPELHYHLPRSSVAAWDEFPIGPVPEFLSQGRPSIFSNGKRQSRLQLSSGRAVANSTFALLELFESDGRKYGLTTDFALMPLDRLEPVVPSSFHGVVLNEQQTLPLVFVRARHAQLYAGSPELGLSRVRTVRYREAFSLSGRKTTRSGQRYLETKEGHWLKDSSRLVRLESIKRVPGWATTGRPWIDVSILRQSLVAYVGTSPVFATLVSTGADGLRDPETTRATVQGQFLVHTKHVSITMSGNEEGDVFDLRDVPYVQYFSGGYALHAAYWHDNFGSPRSHGCVNLSPRDARWLFDWTDPYVPARWHGAMSLLEGTLVHVHP